MANPPANPKFIVMNALPQLDAPATLPKPANLNGAPVVDEDVLVATLRHFGEFGLGAASEALRRADSAFAEGDKSAGQHWLEICRALDRRMANRFANQLGHAQKST